MNPKHQQFVNEYIKLKCSNATEAYCIVYPGSSREAASVSASKLLRIANISEEIQRRVDEECMSANEVLIRLAEEARGDLSNYWKIPESGDPQLNLDGEKAQGKLHLLKKLKIKTTTRTIKDETIVTSEAEIELYDAQAAKALIGRHHKLFTDKQEIGGPNDGPIPVAIVQPGMAKLLLDG